MQSTSCKITADDDCSHESKRCLLLGRKAMTNLDNILKSKDITLPRNVCIVNAWFFPVVMYGGENWTIKKAECWRIDASNCGTGEDSWEFLGLQGDQTSQSYRKSTLNIHWKGWCWSSNTLATWCEELTHWKRPWFWERLKAKGEGGSRGRDGWMASLTQWIWIWANSGDRVKDREAWCAAVHGVSKGWTWLSNWTTATMKMCDTSFMQIHSRKS